MRRPGPGSIVLQTDCHEVHATDVDHVENFGLGPAAIAAGIRKNSRRSRGVIQLRTGIGDEFSGAGVENADGTTASRTAGARGVARVALVGCHEEASGDVQRDAVRLAKSGQRVIWQPLRDATATGRGAVTAARMPLLRGLFSSASKPLRVIVAA